jgi:hypothetical protein
MLQMAPARSPRLPLLLLVMNPVVDLHTTPGYAALLQAAWKADATVALLPLDVPLMWPCQLATQSLQTLQGVDLQDPRISQDTTPVAALQEHTRSGVAMLQKLPSAVQSAFLVQLRSVITPETSGDVS